MISVNEKIKDLILYKSPTIKTPFHNNIKVIFADYIASGRPSPIIEDYINGNVLPYYSNTHSNAYCGIMMKNLVNETKEYIRNNLNTGQKKIIFTGSGTTCAINHLIFCLNLEKNKDNKINIFLTPLEHHSNYLPWIELSKRSNNITVHIIPITDNFQINTNWLEESIKNTAEDVFNIITITACSNVIGIKYNITNIYNMLQKYNTCNCCYGKKNLLFVDYACSAPYVRIDGSVCDAFFFSPHKFLGGISTPGVLIANRELFHNQSPFTPGGGCVKSVCSKKIEYEKDIEKREMAGTPNIVGIIRIKKVLQLKKMMMNTIEHNEKAMSTYVFDRFRQMSDVNNNLIVILPECCIDDRLPIVCIAMRHLHYNLIVALLSDMFGIQTRGGVSCTGILAEMIQKKYNITGWCRISFHWLMESKEIDYIIDSVKYVLENGDQYKEKYKYDEGVNLFTYE